MPATLPTKFEPSQITAMVDSREQLPFDLAPLRTVRGTLHVGDYSVAGLESVVAIERKSLGDLIACCGRERERFQRELDSLRGWPVSAVIVESSWQAIDLGDWRSRITPKAVHASLCSWLAQGHNVILAHDRDKAQQVTRDLLFYAARYRYREVRELIGSMEDARA